MNLIAETSSILPNRTGRDEAGDCADEDRKPSEKMLVWAVDGLAGVTLGGVVGLRPSKQIQKPRSILWGKHAGQLSPWSGILKRNWLQATLELVMQMSDVNTCDLMVCLYLIFE